MGLAMTQPAPHEVTQLLIDWSNGDTTALDKLVPLIHEELRRLAHHYMSRERPGHTLQTTALVDEAYLRLVNRKQVHWQNRAHFFASAPAFDLRVGDKLRRPGPWFAEYVRVVPDSCSDEPTCAIPHGLAALTCRVLWYRRCSSR